MISSDGLYAFCSGDIREIENFDIAITDRTQNWSCHHRLELHPDGSIRYTSNSLKELGLYYNRPASELILIPRNEHLSMHRKAMLMDKLEQEKNKKRLETAREKRVFDDESRQKMKESHTGKKWSEKRRKLFEERKNKGLVKSPWNKGKNKTMDSRLDYGDKVREKLKGKKLSESTKQKMRGRIPWNKKLDLAQDAMGVI